ncbi:MAG: signal peptidase I [Cyanosarcina radialis HA8281-LM2]|jgi:signal peptidase I|nr:signal peptidase I [Cyanosarcina radialis HA8281-LM2]
MTDEQHQPPDKTSPEFTYDESDGLAAKETPTSEPLGTDKKTDSKPKSENIWVELIKTLGIAAVLALGLRQFVVEARYIPSGSMEPTLHGCEDCWDADRVIVNKLSYKFSGPKRGDIIVFEPTEELKRQGYTEAFIKRTIGLPGEKIAIENGRVYINNRPLEEKYLSKEVQTSTKDCHLPNPTNSAQAFLAQPQTIPPNNYLVMGDNRFNSYDGRCWGFVPKDYIVGQAVLRFWPLNRLGGLDK